MDNITNESDNLIQIFSHNPLALISCIILGIGLLFTFASRQFILVRVLLGNVSFIKQRILGVIFGIVGVLLLLFATGNLNL